MEEEKKPIETTDTSSEETAVAETTSDGAMQAQTGEVVASPKSGFLGKLDKLFGVTKSGSSFKVEIFAGLATFLAMCYILTVNPSQILYAGVGDPNWTSVFIATAFGAIVGTLLIAFVAKMPYAQAPGMGLNAMIGTIIGGGVGAYSTYVYHFTFGNAMLLVLISGLIFLGLTLIPAGRDKLTGRIITVREKIFDGIPKGLRQAIPVGIGLFIAYIGFQNSGIIVTNGFTQVGLIDFTNWSDGGQMVQWGSGFSVSPASAIVAIVGLIIIAVLSKANVKGAVVFGILGATLLGMIPMGGDAVTNVGILAGNQEGISWAFWNNFADYFTGDVFLAAFKSGFDFSAAGGGFGCVMTCIMIVISLCLIDMFDTMGTVTGCAMRAGLVDADGKPLNFDKCLYSDAIATNIGALLGTSTVTTFVESGAGVAVGGKTGLTALTISVLFFLSIFLLPIFAMIPSAATASALIYVGVLMMSNVKNIDFSDVKIAVPAFLMIVIMPLGYSITAGIGIGMLMYVIIALLCYVVDIIKYTANKGTEKAIAKPEFDISVVTIIVAALFCIYFFVPRVY